MNIFLEAALEYALRRRWKIFPIEPGGCLPPILNDFGGEPEEIIRFDYHHASNNPVLIKAWWRVWPEANVGLALEESGLMALGINYAMFGGCEFATAVMSQCIKAPVVEFAGDSLGIPCAGFFIMNATETIPVNLHGCVNIQRDYVTLPPSRRDMCGEVYIDRWGNGTDFDNMDAPSWMVKND